MALTAAEYQALIVVELGDDATVSAQIATLWDLSGDRADADDLEGQYLETKIRAIDLLLGRYALKVDFSALNGASVKLGQISDHLRELRAAAVAAQAERAAGGGYQIGELSTTSPVDTDGESPDPGDRAYRGDPLRPPPGLHWP